MQIISDPEFVSSSPLKTPKMVVVEYDCNDNIINTFEVVEGFQLERYLSNLHKDDPRTIEFVFLKNGKQTSGIKAIVKINDKIIKKYISEYKYDNNPIYDMFSI